MRCRLVVLPPVALLTACALPPPQPAMTPAVQMVAEEQANRFDQAFRSGGMLGVAADINNCYATAMASGEQIQTRLCLVYDDFADRFAAQMNRQAHFPIPPYFQPAAVYPRLARYSGPAGFTDAQIMRIMSGYLTHGSNAIYTVIASRTIVAP